MSRHPIQPLEVDPTGVLRFKRNRIVERLLDQGGIDMNTIAMWAAKGEVSREDQEQFAQLIGYSHSGAGDLSYVSTEVLEAAAAMYEAGKSEGDARADYMRGLIDNFKVASRDALAAIFNVHPDDLQ